MASGCVPSPPPKRRRLSYTKEMDYTHRELFKWTMNPKAVAPCFARDVFEMRPAHSDESKRDVDFHWLGRVPCRSVRILGLLVGVVTYDTRITYSVDDGTGVVDCIHHPHFPPLSPQKPSKDGRPSPASPKPIAWVGCTVRVTGRVNAWRENKHIKVDRIERCKSTNEEPIHWREVLALHESHYDSQQPFVIPDRQISVTSTRPRTKQVVVKDEPPPSTQPGSNYVLERYLATLSSSAPSSPIKPETPTRLRHPTKLRSRDLTDVSFRRYVKHYMVHAPIERTYHPPPDGWESDASCPSTPTWNMQNMECEDTPKPRDFRQTSQPEYAPEAQGFTMSFLRRVPALSEMARMVLKAEIKRRARANKEVRTSSTSSVSKEKSGRKTRRLFMKVLQEMLKDGEIIIWDGLVRPLRMDASGDASGLWNDSTASSMGMDSTMFSESSANMVSSIEDEGELSDPQEGEEAYVVVTPRVLAPKVEMALRSLVQRTPSLRPTKAQVGNYLRGTDEALIFIADLDVEDGLLELQDRDVIWDTGKGHWCLCL